MGKYVFAYKGGGAPPEDAEERKKVMDAWMGWFGSLGDSVMDMGNPLGASRVLGAGPTSGLNGYSIISADSLDDAAAKAGGCPIIADGGTIEVYETVAM